MKYNFNQIVPRENTNSYKYDLRDKVFGTNDVLPLWVADMDFKIADEIIEDVNKKVSEGLFGYTFQYEGLFKSLTNWMQKRHNWAITQNNIHFFHGVVPSINLIIQKFSNPGDGIIVQTPVYFPFFQSIENNKRKVIVNELIENNGDYKMDIDGLKRSITPDTKILILCHPHNPVGRMWTKEELLELHAVCEKHNILVISDEIHSDILLSENKHIPWATLNTNAQQNSITLMAPSKTFNIAGLAISAIITQNKEYHSIITESIKENQLHGINLLGLTAFESAYSKGEQWLTELLEYLKANLELIREFCKTHPKIKLIEPEATYLAWLDCRELGLNNEQLKKHMISVAKVGLSDGPSFGKGGDGFQRLNFACPKSVLQEGLNRISKSLESL